MRLVVYRVVPVELISRVEDVWLGISTGSWFNRFLHDILLLSQVHETDRSPVRFRRESQCSYMHV